MTLREIYNLAIELGMETDPRSQIQLKSILEKNKQKFEGLKPEERFEFDKEKLTNPYDDSRLLYEGTKKDLKRVMVGIDIEPAEVVLAKILNNIDAIISHHSLIKNLSVIDAAKLLDIPLLCLQTPTDNLAQKFSQNKLLKKIPEYREAAKMRIKTKKIAFDSLGMNLFLDKIEEKGIKIVPCSGLIRVRR